MDDLRIMIQSDIIAFLVPDGKEIKEYLHNVDAEGLVIPAVGHCMCMFLRKYTGFVYLRAQNVVVWLASSSIERAYDGKQTGAFDA